MDFKIYNNILSDDNISYILNNIDTSQYHSGRVGNRINLKQKINFLLITDIIVWQKITFLFLQALLVQNLVLRLFKKKYNMK